MGGESRFLAYAASPTGQTIQPSVKLRLDRGKSRILIFPQSVKRVAVADPKILEAIVVSPREVVMNAKAVGTTSVLIWDAAGALHSYAVQVELDSQIVKRVAENIRQALPQADIRVTKANDFLVLSGSVSSKAKKKTALDMAGAYSLKKVVDNLHIENQPLQVLLKVHFAEISRSGALNLGLAFIQNVKRGGGDDIGFFPGAPGFSPTGPFLPPISGLPGPDLTFSGAIDFFIGRADRGRGFFLRALQSNGFIRTIAEPHLRVVDGKKATFHVGGEAPVPVPGQDGQVTIMYKPFGIKLEFTPKVKKGDIIELLVRPEVSSVDPSLAVVVSGFNVPGFKSSVTQTQVELRDGETMVISGLLTKDVIKNIGKIPFIGDIPILGELFKSRDFRDSKTELVVLITPTIIRIKKGRKKLELTRSGFMVGRPPVSAGARRSGRGARK